MPLSDANIILAQEEPEAPFTLNRNKLPALTASLTCSPQSQMPLVSLYWQCKSENMKTDCLVAKKIVDTPGTEETAPAPPEASDPISQITHLWLLETAFLGIKQFPKSFSFKVTAALFKVIFF